MTSSPRPGLGAPAALIWMVLTKSPLIFDISKLGGYRGARFDVTEWVSWNARVFLAHILRLQFECRRLVEARLWKSRRELLFDAASAISDLSFAAMLLGSVKSDASACSKSRFHAFSCRPAADCFGILQFTSIWFTLKSKLWQLFISNLSIGHFNYFNSL